MTRHQRNIAIFVLLRNKEGEYLLQRRKNTGYMDGHYDFAASGHVESDESVLETAVREAKEEVGVTVRAEDLKLVRVSQTQTFGNAYISFIFLCESWQGIPTICEPEKCDKLEWFLPKDFPELVTVNVRVMQETNFREDFEFFYSNSEQPL